MTNVRIQNKNCLFIGEGTIARFVIELLLKFEYTIVTCLTSDDALTKWCLIHQIKTLPWHGQDNNEVFAQLPQYEIIFSAGNIYKVPASLFQNNQIFGLNIHDGPLNEMLGFNTPAWALLQGKSSHQIHWHLMTDRMYQGEILCTETINIDLDETATTLNAKCFAAALSSLETILESVSDSGIETISNPCIYSENVTYFSLQQRPELYGFLSPEKSSLEALNTIKALQFGHHSNPLCLAKLCIKIQAQSLLLFQVISGKLISSNKNPNYDVGAILEIRKNILEVNWSDGIFEFQLFPLNSQNENIPAHFQLKVQLPATMSEINAVAQHFGAFETWWIEEAHHFTPIQFPYIDPQIKSSGLIESVPFNLESQSKHSFFEILTGIFAYLARIGDQELVSTPLVFDQKYACIHQQITRLADQLGINRAPLNFQFDFNRTFAEQVSTVKNKWLRVLEAGIFSVDLPLRYTQLNQWHIQVDQPYCLFISDQTDEALLKQFPCVATTALGIIVSPSLNSIRIFTTGQLIKSIHTVRDEIQHLIEQCNLETPLSHLSIVTPDESIFLNSISNGTQASVDALLFDRLKAVFQTHVDRKAIIHRDDFMTYGQLQYYTKLVIQALETSEVKPGEFVGIMMPRSLALLPCLLGVMAFGAACVPMDPSYPLDRLEYVIEDSQMKLLLCLETNEDFQKKARQLTWPEIQSHSNITDLKIDLHTIPSKNRYHDLAYMLYTSGSSGKPKGVMVEHGNLANFFSGMDQVIPLKPESVWLAVTSISFDISLLELLWTLTRGITTVIYDGQDIQHSGTHNTVNLHNNLLDFGLFFWNISQENDIPGPHQYELLLKAAEFGDQNNFCAVWTPERHFGHFGGLYPNPAITSAAIATRTQKIQIRAGSCVFPLHHPVRITEDWSVIDNISNGRVGLAAAPGWMPNDFVIKPENFPDAKQKMFENLELVRQLWRGDQVEMQGPNGIVAVETLPRPVQKELPVWLTIGGNPDNFKRAGEMGVHVLTHLLGQDIQELADKIKLYRQAWQAAGHTGQGKMTLMLHSFIAETREIARETVRQPMKNYLKTALDLVKAAAWEWPLFKKLSENQSQNLDEYFATISDEDMDALLEFAFNRYFQSSGLFGSIDDGVKQAQQLYSIGVNEIGCLIDFGIDTQTVLQHLPYLQQVLQRTNQQLQSQASNAELINLFGVAQLINTYKVTHVQATPSMTRLFFSDPHIQEALKSLDTMLIGGEALPQDLAQTIKSHIKGPLLNMYGPTETTIWSSVSCMHEIPEHISLGKPILNTQISIVDRRRQPLPIGAIGELLIGGAGVVRGYWQRPDLTAEKFLQHYPQYSSSDKVYATGDLARYLPDGRLVFLGRNDFQVKIRGYRIELGEIEAMLLRQPGIAEAIVHPIIYSGAEPRLVGYYSREKNSNFELNSQILKSALAETLPSFMIPNLFVELESFPLTPNAKIDRKALPVPRLTHEEPNIQKVEDASELELKVLAIWQDILGTADFGIEDNFFDHGGHSLLVVDVMTRVTPLFEKQIKLIDLFRYPQVRKLVKHLSSNDEASDTNVVANAQSRAAARRAQRKR